MNKHCKCRVICKEPTSPAWRVSFPGEERLRMLQEQEDGSVRKEHLVWIYRRFIHWKHKCGLREDVNRWGWSGRLGRITGMGVSTSAARFTLQQPASSLLSLLGLIRKYFKLSKGKVSMWQTSVDKSLSDLLHVLFYVYKHLKLL